MSWSVQWEPSALDSATRYLKDDPTAVDSLLRATDQLADEPRPSGSRPLGTEHRRLRHGAWRVLYRLDEVGRIVYIEHVGRVR